MALTTQQEIDAIDSKIASLTASIPAIESSANEWLLQSQVACSFALRSKQDACLADKQMKRNKYQAGMTRIKGIRDEISALTETKRTLIARLNSENKQGELLASQGMSMPAMQVKAQAESEAIIKAGEAQAQVIQAKGVSEIQQENTTRNVIIAVVIIVVVIAVIFVVKKLKKKKK